MTYIYVIVVAPTILHDVYIRQKLIVNHWEKIHFWDTAISIIQLNTVSLDIRGLRGQKLGHLMPGNLLLRPVIEPQPQQAQGLNK